MSRSFLKWAGGKHWLISNEQVRFPNNYNRYIEPFLGGGSVFFYLKPVESLLSDINEELINTYISIRDSWEEVYEKLVFYQKNHTEEYYYKIRNSNPYKAENKAARMIYLNKTCFNGIYRVNKAGKFNVPIGSERVLNFDRRELLEASLALRNTELLCQDFQIAIDAAMPGDFVFCDPPYAVLDENSRFIGYNAEQFTWQDQERLARCLTEAKDRDVAIMMTNVDHPSVRTLYENEEGFILNRLERKCVIAGNSQGRRTYSELIVTANF